MNVQFLFAITIAMLALKPAIGAPTSSDSSLLLVPKRQACWIHMVPPETLHASVREFAGQAALALVANPRLAEVSQLSLRLMDRIPQVEIGKEQKSPFVVDLRHTVKNGVLQTHFERLTLSVDAAKSLVEASSSAEHKVELATGKKIAPELLQGWLRTLARIELTQHADKNNLWDITQIQTRWIDALSMSKGQQTPSTPDASATARFLWPELKALHDAKSLKPLVDAFGLRTFARLIGNKKAIVLELQRLERETGNVAYDIALLQNNYRDLFLELGSIAALRLALQEYAPHVPQSEKREYAGAVERARSAYETLYWRLSRKLDEQDLIQAP